MNKYAYVTLLTNDDYAHMVLALHFNLRAVKAKHDLYCIVTPEVSQYVLKAFDKAGLKYFLRAQFRLPQNIIDINSKIAVNHAWSHCFNKFWMFELPFDKIVYLDSDIFVAKNIDELFNYNELSAVKDLMGLPIINGYTTGPMFQNKDYHDYFNAGVMVIEPSKQKFDHIVNLLSKWTTYQCNDQNFLALSYYHEWRDVKSRHLSVVYNFMAPWAAAYCNAYKDFDVNTVKVWHFCGKKPLAWLEDKMTLDSIATPIYNSWKMITNSATSLLEKAKGEN